MSGICIFKYFCEGMTPCPKINETPNLFFFMVLTYFAFCVVKKPIEKITGFIAILIYDLDLWPSPEAVRVGQVQGPDQVCSGDSGVPGVCGEHRGGQVLHDRIHQVWAGRPLVQRLTLTLALNLTLTLHDRIYQVWAGRPLAQVST